MLEIIPALISTKKNTQPDHQALLKEYHQYVAKQFLSLPNSSNIGKVIFFLLVQHINIKEIEKSSFFVQLKDKVCPAISPQEAFDRAAAFLAKKNNLPNLKYLIEICGFDLSSAKSDRGDTLLHFACARNHKEIIVYLAQKGFDLNAKTLAGKRPIHDLVLFDENASMITQLKRSYGLDLNCKNEDQMTPLHIAALRGNNNVILALKSAKADCKIQFNGRNYLQLKQDAKKGVITIKQTTFNDEGSPAEKNSALFYKALFSDKLHQQNFKVYVEFLKNKTLGTLDQQLFSYASLFCTGITTKNIKKFSSDYVETGKVTKEVFLNTLQELTQWLLTKDLIFYANTIDELNDIQLSLFEKLDIRLPMVSDGYMNLSYWYNLIHLPEKAKHTAIDGLLRLPKEADNQITRSYIFYNLAISQQTLLNDAEAIESFKMAFELNNSDDEIFLKYFLSLIEISDYENAKAICNTANFHEHSKLFTLFAQYQASELSAPEALKELENFTCESSLKTFLLDFQFLCYLTLGDFEEAFHIAKKSFSGSEKFYENKTEILISTALEKFLRACLCTKKYQEGLEFTKFCQIKYPREYVHNISLKKTLFLFYLRIEQTEAAEKVVHELSQSKIDPDILCDLWLNLALHQKDFSKILHYLEIALTISPNSSKAIFYKKLVLSSAVDVINQNEMENSGSSEDIPNSTVSEEITDSIESDAEDQDDTKNWDPKQIHIFFQDQKNKALLALQNSLLKTPQPKGVWKVGETVYREGDLDLFPLNSPLYPDHYVVIDRTLLLDEKYIQALKKGLCDRAAGQDGLKVLRNSLVELKIVGENTRLYTVRVYQNENKCLFILDKIGNHLKIKRELKTHKTLEAVNVSSVSATCQPSKLPSDGNNKPQKSLSNKTHSDNTQPIHDPTGADSFSHPIFAPASLPPDGLPKNQNQMPKQRL